MISLASSKQSIIIIMHEFNIKKEIHTAQHIHIIRLKHYI